MDIVKISSKTLNNIITQIQLTEHKKKKFNMQILEQYYNIKQTYKNKKEESFKEDLYFLQYKKHKNIFFVIRPQYKYIHELIIHLKHAEHLWSLKYQFYYMKFIQGNNKIKEELNNTYDYLQNIKDNINILQKYENNKKTEITNKIQKLKEENEIITKKRKQIFDTNKVDNEYFKQLYQKKNNYEQIIDYEEIVNILTILPLTFATIV